MAVGYGILSKLGMVFVDTSTGVAAIVIDDGSVDGTFERLAEAFSLTQVPCLAPGPLPLQAPIDSCHRGGRGEALTVLRKASVGHKAG